MQSRVSLWFSSRSAIAITWCARPTVGNRAPGDWPLSGPVLNVCHVREVPPPPITLYSCCRYMLSQSTRLPSRRAHYLQRHCCHSARLGKCCAPRHGWTKPGKCLRPGHLLAATDASISAVDSTDASSMDVLEWKARRKAASDHLRGYKAVCHAMTLRSHTDVLEPCVIVRRSADDEHAPCIAKRQTATSGAGVRCRRPQRPAYARHGKKLFLEDTFWSSVAGVVHRCTRH